MQFIAIEMLYYILHFTFIEMFYSLFLLYVYLLLYRPNYGLMSEINVDWLIDWLIDWMNAVR